MYIYIYIYMGIHLFTVTKNMTCCLAMANSIPLLPLRPAAARTQNNGWSNTMANAFVHLSVRNTYYKCMNSSHPDAIREIWRTNFQGNTTCAQLSVTKTMICDRQFPTAAHTQWFSIWFQSTPRETVRQTHLAAARWSETQHATCAAFASKSSRCGRLRRQRLLYS